MRTRVLLAVAAGVMLLAAAVPATPAAPSDLSADPLDRAALLALPSVYRVEVTIRVDALRLSGGRRRMLRPQVRTLTEFGTAVAVADGGWLVTARHLAAPDAATLARLAYQTDLAVAGSRAHQDETGAAAWVAANRARPLGPGVVRVQVTPADAGGGRSSPAVPVVGVVASRVADLALIRIGARGAPALGLDEAAALGTPVETIGFGAGAALAGARRGALEPVIRRGALRRTGLLPAENPEREAILTSIPVQRGDSGAPVVDADGRVRGIVTRSSAEGGIAERATEIRLLLASAGATPGANRSAELFRAGMQEFWRLDLADAADGFTATLGAFPAHSLAGRQRARAQELSAADYRLAPRGGGALGTIAILAAVAALACALALARAASRRRGPPADGR